MFGLFKKKPKEEKYEANFAVEKPKWVVASENGIVVKATGDQLIKVLDKLIEIGQASQAIRTHLYFKCVPEEYRKVVVERNYFKLKYEELVGIPQSENKNVKPNPRPKSIKKVENTKNTTSDGQDTAAKEK